MLSLCSVNSEDLKLYIERLEQSRMQNAFTNVDLAEIRNYFRISDNDTFLMVKCVGDFNVLWRELDYLKIPGKCYGKLFVINGNEDLGIESMITLQGLLESKFDNEETDMLLTWFLDERYNSIEFVMITKVFDERYVSENTYFDSLWDVVISDMGRYGSISFYDVLHKVKRQISGAYLDVYVNDNPRADVVLSLKKSEIEKSIYEYTGKKITIRLV